jgi:hypothetical protein
MVAYIVGMITGTLCMVMPLVYAMNVNACVAQIMTGNPEFDPVRFAAYTPPRLLYAISAIGAVVLLVSTFMMAWTGSVQLKAGRPKPPEVPPAAEPPDEPAPPVAEA